MVYTFRKPATEYGLKNLLRTQIEESLEATNFLVLYGIHGSPKGLLGTHDKALVFSFTSAMETTGRRQSKNISKKQITIDGLEICTKKGADGKNVLMDKDLIVSKSRQCNKLILCYCYTTINEANTFLRSTGLYADLFMAQELSELHGRQDFTNYVLKEGGGKI